MPGRIALRILIVVIGALIFAAVYTLLTGHPPVHRY